MKKQIALLLSLCFLLIFSGCGNNDNASSTENNKQQAEDPIDGYQKADYESCVSKNTTVGDKLYLEGKITDVRVVPANDKNDNREGLYFDFKDNNEKQWVFEVGAYPLFSQEKLKDLTGVEMRVFFKYQGVANELPVGSVLDGKLEEMRFGDKHDVQKKLLSDEKEITSFMEKNAKKINLSDIGVLGKKYKYQMVTLTGIPQEDADNSSKKISFYDGKNDDYINIDLDTFFYRTPNYKITQGKGITIYAMTTDDGRGITPLLIKDSGKLSYTLEDINKQFKKSCAEYNYDEIFRNSSKYLNKKAKFTGEVVQVIGSSSMELRVNVTRESYGYYTDTVYVTCNKSAFEGERVLEGDVITMYGTLMGTKTYTTVRGDEMTIPKFEAKIIELQ